MSVNQYARGDDLTAPDSHQAIGLIGLGPSNARALQHMQDLCSLAKR
jgi:hypothetical protein